MTTKLTPHVSQGTHYMYSKYEVPCMSIKGDMGQKAQGIHRMFNIGNAIYTHKWSLFLYQRPKLSISDVFTNLSM